jgi:hypothetical protein
MDPPVALDSLAMLFADQPVLHAGRRATFLHMSDGEAIIRYWGGSHAVAVPPETLSLRRGRGRSLDGSRLPSLEARDEPLTRERRDD